MTTSRGPKTMVEVGETSTELSADLVADAPCFYVKYLSNRTIRDHFRITIIPCGDS